MEKYKKKHLFMVWAVMVVTVMACLIVLQYHTFEEYNRIKAFKDSAELILEAEDIISGNDDDRENLQEFLKKIYLEKAKTASYIIDSKPELKWNPDQMQTLARDMGVDQIHVIDEKGVIRSGTNPEYYGISLDDGEQIRFFLPMLKDRSLSMSQNIMPNTAEGRNMLYAMCWNKSKGHMVQVGVYGERFPRILNRNRIHMFLDLVPDNLASDILLTDLDGDIIVASTSRELVGKKLSQVGIELQEEIGDSIVEFTTGSPRNPIYCSGKNYRNFRILAAQYKNKANENIPITLFTFTEYLVLVFIAMTYVVDRFYDKFIQEKNHAMRDKLTDLYSRRAYEVALTDLEQKPLDENLVLVAMDVNGLKTANDTLGHQKGDQLLMGAASCMMECFGPFGKVYRFGGDEFAALIYIKDIEIEPLKAHLQALCRSWSEKNGLELSVSLGFSASRDSPDSSIHTLEAIADQQMYADKARFYSQQKHDRRSGHRD